MLAPSTLSALSDFGGVWASEESAVPDSCSGGDLGSSALIIIVVVILLAAIVLLRIVVMIIIVLILIALHRRL